MTSYTLGTSEIIKSALLIDASKAQSLNGQSQ